MSATVLFLSSHGRFHLWFGQCQNETVHCLCSYYKRNSTTTIDGIMFRHLFFLVVLLTFTTSCNNTREKVSPVLQEITESVYASGVVKSRSQYQVFSAVNGIIKEIMVDEGDTVSIGQPLFKIFNKTSELNRQNAALAAEYARLDRNRQRLEELSLAIDVARKKMTNDSLLLQRQQNLWNQNIGSKIDLEQRQLNYQNSIKDYKSAQLRYGDLRRDLELNAKQSQTNLEISSAIAEDYIIKSEINGKVYSVLKEPGELVTSQNAVALLGAADSFMLELEVDEYDVSRVKIGQMVFIRMDSYEGKVFEGEVTKINPVLNERANSFTVEAAFSTQPPVLFPFLTVEANIVIQQKKNALTIPRQYLIDNEFVITENDKRRKVEVGLMDYERVEIISGLSPDEIILKPED